MSAIVCGKRSYFEELVPEYSSPATGPVAKRLRCRSSTSPVRFSPPLVQRTGLIDRLKEAFPSMDHQVLEKTLEECGDDIDAAMKRLHELCLGTADVSASANNGEAQIEQGGSGATDGADPISENALPADGAQWVEVFVREMMSSSCVDDARARAARVLEVLEKSIRANAGAEAAEKYQKENVMLKEQIEGLFRENSILKRAVQIQHERQKEFDDRNQEVQQLKQLLSQYQEQLRGLEVNNYALTMHLKQAQQSSSIPSRFHPDIF